MADRKRLYFTVGPVQAFVAQSRKTRDLWASSYLLSYLTDAAMTAIERQYGKIVLPARHESGTKADQGQALHGRWPNRFVAVVDEPQSAADAARNAFLNTWKKIADRVWETYVKQVASAGKETEAIWNRQVNHFWEISWAATSANESQFDPLIRRKNWRTPPVTIEPGDHCVMMPNWQELSGYIRSQERKNQDTFWASLRNFAGQSDIRENERLCSIALIKRMFPKIASDLLGQTVNSDRWLSTPYLAAIPWIRNVCSSHPDAANTYLKVVDRLCPDKSWRREDPHELARYWEFAKECKDFIRIDGDLFQETALANQREIPLIASGNEDIRIRGELIDALHKLQETVSSKPSSFYALLLMDGDSMGQLLSEARQRSGDTGERSVTKALGKFASDVPETVSKYDGVTVYCGGDDVLAMLPVDSALRCALSLSRRYQASFAETCPEISSKATISAAIIYCPFHAPFREVIEFAHHFLDRIAKDATGRDSLAVAVMKSGGITCQWAAPWKYLVNGETTILDVLVERLRDRSGKIGELSSRFLFQIRNRFAALTNQPLTIPGQFGRLPQDIDVETLLLGEYCRVRSHLDNIDPPADSIDSNAATTVQLLLKTCRKVHRIEGIDERSLGIDGPLLVRFLSGETRGAIGDEEGAAR